MSSIEKLNIIGVRSFDHKTTGENIVFKAPLTLIIGDNGSGKTTIIESLKYASTGELPPGATKNGAFIHDPKLTGEDEVCAQVKMKFRNAQGLSFVTSRRVSCTVQPGGAYKQKAMEVSLAIEGKDDRQSLSMKVGQMNTAVPHYMGVSSAILQNVIFCHQDDSLWPMSEPKVLKEKFDQIFEAEKYTKAIESLDKMKKAYLNQLKVLDVEEKHSKENNNKAKRAKQRMLDLEAIIADKGAKIENLDSEILVAKESAKEKQELMQQALGVVNEMENKRQKAANIKWTLDNLLETLEVQDKPTAWLESTLAEFDEQMRKYNQQATDLQDKYNSIMKSLDDTRQRLSAKQRDQGKEDARKKQHEANLQDRVEQVRDAALSHGLRGYDGDLDEDMIKEFIARVDSMNTAKDREFTRVKEATANKVGEHNDAMNKIERRIAGRKQERSTAKTQIATNNENISRKQTEMNAIEMDEGKKAALDTSLRDSKERLKNAQSTSDSAGWSKKLASEKRHLAELEEEYAKLGQELLQRTKTMEDTAALNLARKEAQQAQTSLNTMMDSYSQQLTKFIGHDWIPDTLQRDYNAALARLDERISDAGKAKANADRMEHEHSLKLKTLKSDLAKNNAEAERCKVAMLGSITPLEGKPISSVEEYLEELQDLEKSHEDAQKDVDGFAYISNYYKKALGAIQKKNCCSLCDRGFANPNETRSATDKINRLLEKYATNNLEKELRELRELTTELKKAQNVRPQYDVWKRLVEVDIPALKKDIQVMEEKSQSFQSRCEQQDEKVALLEAEKRDAKTLSNSVAEITKHNVEISKQEDRVTSLSSQQKLSGSSLTLEEIEEQQGSCNEKIKSAKAKVEKISADRETARTEITDLEREVGITSTKVNKAEHLLEKKKNLIDSITSLQDNTSQQRELIKSADTDVRTLEPELAKEKEQRDDVLRRGDEKAAVLQADKMKLGVTVGKLKSIERNIDEYLTSGGPDKLAACERAIASLEKELQQLENERKDITLKSNEVNNLVSDSAVTKRSIHDNILYRRSLAEHQRLQKEIEALEARDTQREYERSEREAKSAEKRIDKLSGERTRLFDQVTTDDENLREMIKLWEQDYAHIALKWQEDNIKVQTTKAISQDLQKCITALDKAIIAFHTKKMEDVNTIAAELWRSTYQGTDVDTIMIKSEDDRSKTTTTRKYNYRLVMVKGPAELDMRGRCSAGQRVLASIIIRLALAESFGMSCGVIALDEPTTNLDTDNIKALARSLHTIIQNRQHQKNFQLIVITHDEAFIREMKCRDFTDEYYRVSRNADQNSRIMKQDLSIIDDD